MWWKSPGRRVEAKFAELKNLAHITAQEVFAMSAEMDHLKAAVASQTEVSKGVAVLLADLSQRLKDAVLTDDLVEVEAIADEIDANNMALQAAMVANTPVATETPAPPVEPAPVVDPAPADPTTV